MNKHIRRAFKYQALIPLLAMFGLIASASSVYATTTRYCNGLPVKWWTQPVEIIRNRCTIPDTGLRSTAYFNGARQWTNISNITPNFKVFPANRCSMRSYDNANEVMIKPRSTIDGAHGRAFLWLGPCLIGANEIDEADIVIADDMAFDNKLGNFFGVSGRSVFVHEFGHMFGFIHRDTHTVMRATTPSILTGGIETSTVWPVDVLALRNAYGLSSGPAPNLLPSAHGSINNNVSLLNSGTIFVCRGNTVNVTFYLGNSGFNASGTYNLRLRLATTPTSYVGTISNTFTHALAGFGEGVFTLPLPIPNVANGNYFIQLQMDYTDSIAEVREYDNSTVSGMMVNVFC